MASMCSLLSITVGGLTGGLLGFSFTPTIESDTVIAQASLPYGSPRHRSVAVQKALVDAANEVIREHRIDSSGVFALIGTRLEEGEVEIETLAGSHYVSVLVALPPNESRSVTGRAFAHAWQTAFGDPGGLEALNFTGETNVTGGEPIRLELFHPIPSMAREAALLLGKRLRDVPGLSSIDDGIRTGKPELVLRLKESGLHMGITAEEMARQVRHRFHGVEILRFVRGSSEIKVRVRLCEAERKNPGALREVLLKSPSDAMVPLTEVADISPTQAFTTLARRDGRRIYPVTADIGFGFSDDGVEDILEAIIVPRMIARYPGLTVTFGGEEEEIDASLRSLGNGFLIVLGVMFMLFAFYFNNTTQPLLVLSVIPFSLIGAVWGHILFDVDLSIISVIGIIAMAGVVVNDSLVLVTAYNRCRDAGRDPRQAVVDAACHRFRPILLTSVTTFCGLMPLMLERSEQAQFLIPAAISISFGLVFGTIVTLVFVPSLLGLFSGRLSG
jgi:multidrug efflux pump subunit AcrB